MTHIMGRQNYNIVKIKLEERINVEKSLMVSFLRNYVKQEKRIFASSSFQTHSIPMLHLLNEIQPNLPIYFIDTGFHFSETINYRDQIAEMLNLNLQSVKSSMTKLSLLSQNGKVMFTTDPNKCCHLNKVVPMDSVANNFDVWITGVRKDQSKHREGLNYEAEGANGILRFHPMLNWNEQMINLYISKHNLPAHPLEQKGYTSVGCQPCTGKPRFDERSGRWVGLNKTECGLHLNLK